LLSDVDRTVGGAYGVARPATHKWAAVPRRTTFLIDPERTKRGIYDVTDVAHHADQVLTDLRELTRGRLKVDVPPSQAEQLGASRSGDGGEHQQRVQVRITGCDLLEK
jgi:alkyl hydroperoxide reductase subunit AhpC